MWPACARNWGNKKGAANGRALLILVRRDSVAENGGARLGLLRAVGDGRWWHVGTQAGRDGVRAEGDEADADHHHGAVNQLQGMCFVLVVAEFVKHMSTGVRVGRLGVVQKTNGE